MSKTAYVFSTIANDMKYTEWVKSGNDLPMEGRAVLIKGGTGVMNSRIITPIGVCTEIDESDIPVLKANPVFAQHEKDGFVVIRTKPSEPEKVAADMNLKDPCSPLNDSSFVNQPDSVAKPSTMRAA